MFRSLRLYCRLIGISFQAQMQHRASFFMLATAHFIATFMEIVAIWVLFDRFQLIKGWTFPELALIYGIIHIGFATAESLARGFDSFYLLVRNGDFDRLLLRPLGTLFQVATSEIQLMRVGRLLQGLIVLIWAYQELHLSSSFLHFFIITLAILGTICLFYGLFVIQATLSFWTIEALELMNITTYGGVESGQYPMSIYPLLFRLFFTFVIPLACVAYYPIATILQHETIPFWVGALTPLAGIIFLYFACRLWNFGVKHYQSTGS